MSSYNKEETFQFKKFVKELFGKGSLEDFLKVCCSKGVALESAKLMTCAFKEKNGLINFD